MCEFWEQAIVDGWTDLWTDRGTGRWTGPIYRNLLQWKGLKFVMMQLEISNDAAGAYNTNSQIKFKTTIIKSNICG